MREVLETTAQTIGYVVVTSAAIWLIIQHTPSP
jgi:hypothetical protein